MEPITPSSPITPVPPSAPIPPRRLSKLEELLDLLHTPWAIAVIVILVGITALIFIRQMQGQTPVVVAPTPTPTATPTPTPVRTASPFATSSAFISLDNTVASFSGAVKTYNTSDPSLSPPAIDLPLGFSN